MKTLIAILAMMSSVAQAKTIHCSNGPHETDNYAEVVIEDGSLSYGFHESGFTIPASEVDHRGNSYAALERDVVLSAEGEDFAVVVTALAVYDPGTKTLNTTLLIDGEIQHSAVTFTCHSL